METFDSLLQLHHSKQQVFPQEQPNETTIDAPYDIFSSFPSVLRKQQGFVFGTLRRRPETYKFLNVYAENPRGLQDTIEEYFKAASAVGSYESTGEHIGFELEAIDKTEEVFHTLATQWREETNFVSSSTDLILHPAYQQIIGLGPTVITHLLRDLQIQPSPPHWFWALQSITRENPVSPDDYG
jgi:hypothetical protein